MEAATVKEWYSTIRAGVTAPNSRGFHLGPAFDFAGQACQRNRGSIRDH